MCSIHSYRLTSEANQNIAGEYNLKYGNGDIQIYWKWKKKNQWIKGVVPEQRQITFSKKSIVGLKTKSQVLARYIQMKHHHCDLVILLLFCGPKYLVNKLQADLHSELKQQFFL